jgi:hypothetical protein
LTTWVIAGELGEFSPPQHVAGFQLLNDDGYAGLFVGSGLTKALFERTQPPRDLVQAFEGGD